MKVLFVAPSNSIHTKRWINRASFNGVESFLYDQIAGGRDSIPQCKEIFFIPDLKINGLLRPFKTIINFYQHFFKLRKILKSNTFDLVHIHWLFDISVLAVTFQKNLRMVITPWGSDIQYRPKSGKFRFIKIAFNRFLISRLARRAMAVCCDSEAQKVILQKAGAIPEKIKIIYFGTDVQIYKPENRSNQLRLKYGATDNSVLVISNRSHEPVYDIPTFIRASKSAFEKNQNLRFILAGSGSLTSDYINLINELGMKPFFYLPGRMDDAEFSSSTASCDIYVSTSTSDGGLAASTAEAMASGLPVLISDFGENSSWLHDQSAGYVFPIGDHNKLAEQLISLSIDSEKRRILGENGREIIKKFNNSEVEWKKVSNLYESIK